MIDTEYKEDLEKIEEILKTQIKIYNPNITDWSNDLPSIALDKAWEQNLDKNHKKKDWKLFEILEIILDEYRKEKIGYELRLDNCNDSLEDKTNLLKKEDEELKELDIVVKELFELWNPYVEDDIYEGFQHGYAQDIKREISWCYENYSSKKDSRTPSPRYSLYKVILFYLKDYKNALKSKREAESEEIDYKIDFVNQHKEKIIKMQSENQKLTDKVASLEKEIEKLKNG